MHCGQKLTEVDLGLLASEGSRLEVRQRQQVVGQGPQSIAIATDDLHDLLLRNAEISCRPVPQQLRVAGDVGHRGADLMDHRLDELCLGDVEGAEPHEGLMLRLNGFSKVVTSPGVEQVGRGDVGESLSCRHVGIAERAAAHPVKVQGTEATLAIAEGEGEDRNQTFAECMLGELREPIVLGEVRDHDGFVGLEGRDARAFIEIGLEPFETQRRGIGGRDLTRRSRRRDQRHAGGIDWQQVHDAVHQVIEDAPDWKVGGNSASELAQHVGQPTVVHHEVPRPNCARMRSAGPGGDHRAPAEFLDATRVMTRI